MKTAFRSKIETGVLYLHINGGLMRFSWNASRQRLTLYDVG